MQIVDNKAILLESPNPEQLVSVIDKAAIVAPNKVLVKWTLQAAQTLARLGYRNVPSPIAKSYGYPHKPDEPPYDHQRAMAGFMVLHKKCFNFSEMGTGKSRGAIWAADYLMTLGVVKRVLIIAPLSILYSAWKADLFATAMHRSVEVAVGDAKRRAKIIGGDAEFVIINHDGIKFSRLELVRAKFDLIIVDEASAVTNATTDRWKALNSLVTKDTWLWLLTGTPAANSPLQAYGLAKLVCPERVPKFFNGWRDLTMHKVSTFTYIPKADAQAKVFAALQPAIRFDKKDCLDLPPVTFVEREVPMDPVQQKYYNAMKNDMLMHAADKQITAVNSGVLMGKLLQVAAGSVYSDDGSVVDFRAKSRINEMLQIIAESEHKVIVFAQYRHTIRMLLNVLADNDIDAAALDGSVPQAERTRIIDAFQKTAQYKVLVLQPKVASHGITLTAANVAIWYSPVSSLEHWRQANDRINRIGQVNKMTVVKLIGSPIERKVYAVLERRDGDQTDLLNLYREELRAT